MFFPSSGGLINISGNLSVAGGPGMTLCANNMLSLLGKQVYSIQLIDYSQDTCYPAMKNRRRTMRLKVGCRINTWQNSKPGKIRQKTHLLYIAGGVPYKQRHRLLVSAQNCLLTHFKGAWPSEHAESWVQHCKKYISVSSYKMGIFLFIYLTTRGVFH